MRLSWNEVRARAAKFAREWAGASYEKGETQSFYNEFFGVFGVKRRSVARYEEHVRKLDDRAGFIDLFWPGVLIVEQKSAGRDLASAYGQAGDYFDALPENQRPRYILVSDFQTFELHVISTRGNARTSRWRTSPTTWRRSASSSACSAAGSATKTRPTSRRRSSSGGCTMRWMVRATGATIWSGSSCGSSSASSPTIPASSSRATSSSISSRPAPR